MLDRGRVRRQRNRGRRFGTTNQQQTDNDDIFHDSLPRGIQFDLGRAEAEFILFSVTRGNSRRGPCGLIVRSSQVLSIAAWGCGDVRLAKLKTAHTSCGGAQTTR